jgi:hypothetical protein
VGKNGSERHHILVDGASVPLSLVLTGANRRDVTQLFHGSIAFEKFLSDMKNMTILI